MTKQAIGVLLALCLVATGAALARVAVTATSSGGTAVSTSAGKQLVSSLGGGFDAVTLNTGCRSSRVPATSASPGNAASLEPSAMGLRPNYPNPFNPATIISYRVDEGAHVTLTVHDVSGRRVATLVDASAEGDTVHAVTWNGTNGRGDPLPSGVYLLKIVTERFAQTRKMVLLR